MPLLRCSDRPPRTRATGACHRARTPRRGYRIAPTANRSGRPRQRGPVSSEGAYGRVEKCNVVPPFHSDPMADRSAGRVEPLKGSVRPSKGDHADVAVHREVDVMVVIADGVLRGDGLQALREGLQVELSERRIRARMRPRGQKAPARQLGEAWKDAPGFDVPMGPFPDQARSAILVRIGSARASAGMGKVAAPRAAVRKLRRSSMDGHTVLRG